MNASRQKIFSCLAKEPSSVPPDPYLRKEITMSLTLPEIKTKISTIRIHAGNAVSLAHYYNPDSELQFSYDIEWIAVKEKGRAVLLLSRDCLYCLPFDESGVANWCDSSLRSWLNGEFLEKSFREYCAPMILPTPADRPLDVGSIAPYERPSEARFRDRRTDQDCVFLLSNAELCELFEIPSRRKTKAAQFAGSGWSDSSTVNWWLRPDPDSGKNCVNSLGEFTAVPPDSKDVFVRPAVWIDNFYLESYITEAVGNWRKLVHEAKKGLFNYDLFRDTASYTYSILHMFNSSANTEPCYPKLVVKMIVLITQFSAIPLKEETNHHRLALNAASSFITQCTKWRTIYRRFVGKTGIPGTGALQNAFVMNDLEGRDIVVNTKDFDMEHPISPNKLLSMGCFTLY